MGLFWLCANIFEKLEKAWALDNFFLWKDLHLFLANTYGGQHSDNILSQDHVLRWMKTECGSQEGQTTLYFTQGPGLKCKQLTRCST